MPAIFSHESDPGSESLAIAARIPTCVLNPNIVTGTEDHASLAALVFTLRRTMKGAICFS
jgi:hypothetical protein